jgi:hypothetical protein
VSGVLHRQLAQRAYELLGDGKWHDYEKTLRELAKLVPPGVALRKNEMRRAQSEVQRRRKGLGVRTGAKTGPVFTVEQQMESGRREIVRTYLGNDFFEVDEHGLVGRNYSSPPLQRNIRMLYPPRAIKTNAAIMRTEMLQAENEVLRDQVKALRGYLVALGYEATAHELAPEVYEG